MYIQNLLNPFSYEIFSAWEKAHIISAEIVIFFYQNNYIYEMPVKFLKTWCEWYIKVNHLEQFFASQLSLT